MSVPEPIMAMMHRAIFGDTSCLYALADASDPDHELFVALFDEALRQKRLFVATTYIIAETHALLLRRLGRDVAAEWLRQAFDALLSFAPLKPMKSEPAKSSFVTPTRSSLSLMPSLSP